MPRYTHSCLENLHKFCWRKHSLSWLEDNKLDTWKDFKKAKIYLDLKAENCTILPQPFSFGLYIISQSTNMRDERMMSLVLISLILLFVFCTTPAAVLSIIYSNKLNHNLSFQVRERVHGPAGGKQACLCVRQHCYLFSGMKVKMSALKAKWSGEQPLASIIHLLHTYQFIITSAGLQPGITREKKLGKIKYMCWILKEKPDIFTFHPAKKVKIPVNTREAFLPPGLPGPPPHVGTGPSVVL